MPRTVEHIVEVHDIATQRRAAGRPVWAHTIDLRDVFHNADMSLEQRRDAIVARLRAHRWLKGRNVFDQLVEAVQNLAYADDAEEFNGWWDEICDLANIDRVWLATR